MTESQPPQDLSSSERFHSEVPRRDFLGLAALWSFLVAGFAMLLGMLRLPMPSLFPERGSRFPIGPADRFPPGSVTVIPERKLIVENDKGGVFAMSLICTHLGCIPSWLPNDHKFKCPCHGSGYTQDGTNFEGPAPRPLERFKIYLDGETVVVDRSTKFLAMGPNDTAVWNEPDAYIPV